MGPYRKHYQAQHVLIRLLEEWKANLDKTKFGAVLLDFSKPFTCPVECSWT